MSRVASATGIDRRQGVAGAGRVMLWNGGSVWVGRDPGSVQAHSHHAIQITLASARAMRIRAAAEPAWHETPAAIVMSDRWHLFDGLGHVVAMIFVEPETAAGRALLTRYGQHDMSVLDDATLAPHAAALHGVFESGGTDAALVDAAHAVVECLAATPVGHDVVDPRVARVLQRMRARPGEDLDLARASAIANLSPSRFRHLFVTETGISFRAYLLWARVGDAVVRGMTGSSWTEAAQQAGFADSAHLSRTCRRMFGIAPTMLLPQGGGRREIEEEGAKPRGRKAGASS